MGIPLTDPPLFTVSARRHVRLLLRTIRPWADGLDRSLRGRLRNSHDDATCRAMLACTPAAACRLRSLTQFLEQVEYNGRRLAKLNATPAGVDDALQHCDVLLAAKVDGAFQPAREQLRLATRYVLNHAFYRVREAETQAFFGLYRAETEAHDLDDLLRRFMQVLSRVFRARAGRLLLDGHAEHPRPARPLYVEPGGPKEAAIVEELRQCRCASYWSYPMACGRMQFGFATPYPWLPRELTLMEAAAGRCQEAIDRARLREEVRRLEAAAHSTEREERYRIGRELHDEAGQSLLLLRLKLEMAERGAPASLRAELAEARGIAEQTVGELRRIIAALSPGALERLGLKEALRLLVARFQKLHSAHVRLQIAANTADLPRQIEEVIYRVAQESLQNIAKHSQATSLNLSLQSSDKRIRLRVRDNGVGISQAVRAGKPATFGLAGMRERAALLGGTLLVQSQAGNGVTVTLELPRNPATVARNGMAGNGKDSRTVD